MIVKLPASYDISHWKEVVDFKLVNPRPALFITKATEDVATVDSKFIRFFEGMMKIGCIRGVYHFNRKAFNPYKQADHFIKTISRVDILPTDFLILDVEELGTSASSMWAWFKTVGEAFPDNRLLLYSSVKYLNPIYMTAGEKEFFKKIPVWAAGYPYSPDLYPSIPKGYIPDQTKYGKPVLWQYTSHGRVDGITTELGKPTDVDINWIEPEFYKTLGSNAREATMAIYVGAVSSDIPAKVWTSVGGARIYPDLSKGTDIVANGKTGEYLNLTSPVVGVSKTAWFSITEVPAEPPPPPPPPSEEYILHVNGSVIRKFILNG